MDDHLSNALAEELGKLKSICLGSSAASGPLDPARESFDRVVAGTAGIVSYLAQAPQTPAETIAGRMGLDRNELELSYKLIQRTAAATDRLKASPNGDYLNIVKHYFINRMYVVVFFVGLACPGRCRFCPNVTVRSDGSRKISRYQGKKSDRISSREINSVFRDMSEIESRGVPVLVKISGGLEPLSDPETMAVILGEAHARGIRVKLFTNGLLLDTGARRRLALDSGDVRISLSVIEEADFGEVMFGNDLARRKKYGLAFLLDNISNLLRERDILTPDTRVGLNTIVLEENYRDIPRFIRLAEDLGVDYIDFKPNYFSPYEEETQAYLKETIGNLQEIRKKSSVGIYFAGSLSSDNLFWTHRDGVCHPHKQSRYKLFITPHGNCSPVHHGAFPTAGTGHDHLGKLYSGGRLSPDQSLLDIIGNMPAMPDLEYEKLNPFEHMLALEIDRDERDRAWGIPKECDPYNYPLADNIRQIRDNPLLHRI